MCTELHFTKAHEWGTGNFSAGNFSAVNVSQPVFARLLKCAHRNRRGLGERVVANLAVST
jgi:hypothetical protein